MKCAVLLAALFAATAHAERPADYAFGMPIAPMPGVAFHVITVPAAAYEGVRHRDLADLRVFNADGGLLPFAFVPRAAIARERPQPVSLPMFPLYVDRDRRDVDGLALTVVRNAAGTTISVNAADGEPAPNRVLAGYVLDVSAHDNALAALVFDLPATSGVTTMRLRIDASDDLATWRSVMSDATLVDLQHAGQRLTRDRIELPPTKAKYLRLSWRAGAPAIDFRAVKGEFGERPIEVAREWRPVSGTKVADRDGDYEYDLGGPFPIDRVGVDLAAPNSIVPASLFARNAVGEPWQPVATTVFYRLAPSSGQAESSRGVQSQSAGDVVSPPVAVDGGGRRYWLLRIDPRSGVAGTAAPPMRVGWRPQEIIFAARGPGPFMLAFGKHAATPGALPISTLVPDYDSTRQLPANLAKGQPGERVALGGESRLQKPPDVKRWTLWAALVLGALVLGWMAWRLSRDMNAKPPTDESGAAQSTTIAKSQDS
jgi:hypothetical protein